MPYGYKAVIMNAGGSQWAGPDVYHNYSTAGQTFYGNSLYGRFFSDGTNSSYTTRGKMTLNGTTVYTAPSPGHNQVWNTGHYDVTANYSKVEVTFNWNAPYPGVAAYEGDINLVSYNTLHYVTAHGTAPADREKLTTASLTSSDVASISATGWHFDGWYYDEEYTVAATSGAAMKIEYAKYPSGSSYDDLGRIYLYAKWTPYYTVSFDTLGGSAVASQQVISGGTATRPASNPTKSGGAQFDNWYTSTAYTTLFDFTTPITGPTTVYARWFDFGLATVKYWFIPEGEVKQIVDSQGRLLWQRKVLTSITLSGQTTSFTKGSTFSFGGTVTAHYSNGETANVTSSTTFSGYNMNNVGTQTVTASYTEDGVTKTATYNITVSYATYTLKYYYDGMGNGKGRMRVNYTKANGSTAWGTTTTATTGQSSTITVTAAKSTSVTVQMYNDSKYSASFRVYQTKNGSSTQLTSQSISANSNKTWTSGNLSPGNDNTLTLRVEYR